MAQYWLSIVSLLFTICQGFPPSFRDVTTVPGASLQNFHHEGLTKEAVSIALEELFLANPNRDVNSTAAINRLRLASFRDSNLFGAYYEGTDACVSLRCLTTLVAYNEAVRTISRANSDVEDVEELVSEAHFDNEKIAEGNNRIIVLKQSILDLIHDQNFAEARINTGRALHTIQDFYSHSNWIENGHTKSMDDLGRERQLQFLVPNVKLDTCVDCPSHSGGCRNNIIQEIIDNDVLISGHFSSQQDKPPGKCSHGGTRDASRTFSPIGGISKSFDIPSQAPHYYHHAEAGKLALNASMNFLWDIRVSVGDIAFASFLDVEIIDSTVKSISFAYVIDTTGSMSEELPELQALLPNLEQQLRNYEASLTTGFTNEYIFVPFNDPDPGDIKTTGDVSTLINYIGALVADGGGDCREPSIGAIIRAASQSADGGTINVFTDAPPSDEGQFSTLQSIIERKRLRVNFVTTIGCSKKRSAERYRRQSISDPYELLAAFSGGLNLQVGETDISSLGSLLFTSIKPTTQSIYQESMPSIDSASETITFVIDSTVTEFQVSVSGVDLQVQGLISPTGVSSPNAVVSVSSSFTYVATIPVSDSSEYGTWSLTLSTSGSYRVDVTGDSHLFFNYGLFRSNSQSRSGIERVKEKVVKGESLLLFAEVNEDIERANITAVNILNSDGSLHDTLSLTALGQGYYLANMDAPSSFFQVQVAGVDSKGYSFTRINDAGVDTTDVRIVLAPGQSPFITLRSNEDTSLDFQLHNLGPQSTFEVMLFNSTSDNTGFTYYLQNTDQPIDLEMSEVANVSLFVSASEDISSANSLSIVITMIDTMFMERSNFLNIEIVGTSVPPVNDSEIIFVGPEDIESFEFTFPVWIGAGVVILGALLCFFIFGMTYVCSDVRTFYTVSFAVHMNLCVALGLAFGVSLGGIEYAIRDYIGCAATSSFVNYFFTASFTWIFCEAILVCTFSFFAQRKFWIFAFLIIGWGIPVIPAAVSLALYHDTYMIPNRNCWLLFKVADDNQPLYTILIQPMVLSFMVPKIAVIVMIILCIVVGFFKNIYSTARSFKRLQSSLRSPLNAMVWFLWVSVILITVLLGFTWTFALFTVNYFDPNPFNGDNLPWIFMGLACGLGVFLLIFALNVIIINKCFDYERFYAKASAYVSDAGGKNYRNLDINVEDEKTFMKRTHDPSLGVENPVFSDNEET